MNLTQIIAGRIKEEGPVSFHDFMEMALYYPGVGYYTSSREKLGAGGDFYTSPYLTSLFGAMVAGQLEEMWQLMGCEPFTIVEYGAGTGLLAADILHRLSGNSRMYDKLQYVIIEKSESMQEKKRMLLPDKVRWVGSIAEIGPVTGCVLSNELVDNFSVHQVVMEGDLMEVFVDYEEGKFRELFRPASDELKDYLIELRVNLAAGTRTEINLEATEWIKEISSALKKGFVLTIDYGGPSGLLYSKKQGTLVCYHGHHMNHSPYDFIGEQDITSDVNFSALDHYGRASGLECCGYTTQTHFLQGLGLAHYLQQIEAKGGAETDAAKRQQRLWQLRTLLLEMGRKFKVLIQRKGVERMFLSGMQFAERYA